VNELKWDIEEEVLLIELFYFLKENGRDNRSHYIHELSKALNVRADILGLEKGTRSHVFRNYASISIKLANIEFIAADGKSGLASYSDLDKETFMMYHNEPTKFSEVSTKTKSKYGVLFMDTNKDIQNNSVSFHNWLINFRKLSEASARSYVSDLNTISEYAIQNGISKKSVFYISKKDELKVFSKALFSVHQFIKKNKIQHNRYSAAIDNYFLFLNSAKDELPLFESILVSDFSYSNPVKQRQKKEKIAISEFDKQYLEVMKEFFPKGFKLNSVIDTKKFRHFFEMKFDHEVCADDALISKSLSKLCIKYDDVRVMSSESAIDKTSLDELLKYIEEVFDDGKTAIYYEALYSQFEDMLINTNIYNAKILKQVLAFHLQGKYHFARSYIVAGEEKKADPAYEIVELLKKKMTPMSFEEIVFNLPHIAEVKVKEILRQLEFIAVENRSFSHISTFYISDDDLEMLKETIQGELEETGFIAIKKFFSAAEGKLKSFLDKAGITTYYSLRNILAYYFGNEFDFVYNFIGERGQGISPSGILRDFVSDKETFTTTEVTNYVQEIGISQLVISAYLDEIANEFLKINEKDYVRKETITFNAEMVDAAIEKFCIDGYVPLLDINRYAIFPSVSVPWNTFLLESYVHHYSSKYEIMSYSYSLSKSIGAVVDRNAGFANYDEVLAEAIAKEKRLNLNNTSEIINYLGNQGYIGRKSLKNVDSIIALARIKNEKGM
jgi:hypothetical protein